LEVAVVEGVEALTGLLLVAISEGLLLVVFIVDGVVVERLFRTHSTNIIRYLSMRPSSHRTHARMRYFKVSELLTGFWSDNGIVNEKAMIDRIIN